MKDSRMKKLECKLGIACLRSSWVIAKQGSFETLATVATSTLGSKNRGRTRRSREGSPSAQLLVEHFWTSSSRY